jgi:hypothetical protein
MDFPFQSDDETDAALHRFPRILAICLGCIVLFGGWGLWKVSSGREQVTEPQVPVSADAPKQESPVAAPPLKTSEPRQRGLTGRRNVSRSNIQRAHGNQHPVPFREGEFFGKLGTAKSASTGVWLKFTRDYWHNTVSDWHCTFEGVLFTTPGSPSGILVSFYPYATNPYVKGVCYLRPGVDSSKFANNSGDARLTLIHGTIERIDESGDMQFSDCEFKSP